MAVNVDTVYKTVLLILNKEQRGYMTPDEFNKIGTQVQREIFERYFEDLNQQVRIPQTDMEYADRVAITDEKIAEFKTELAATYVAGTPNKFTVPSDLYRLGSATYQPTGSTPLEIQRIGRAEYYNINKSKLTTPTTTYPLYLYEDNQLIVYPNSITTGEVICQYVKKPTDIRWGYSVGSVGQYTYDSTTYGVNLINNGGDLTDSITTNPTGITQDGTYTGLTTTVSPAGGTGTQFSAEVLGGTVTSVTVTTQGSGYNVGDILTVDANQFTLPPTGAPPAPADDLEVTLQAADLNGGSTYGSTDFGLHNSEQVEVILNILLYSGIVIRDPQIIQTASALIQKEEANEKS